MSWCANISSIILNFLNINSIFGQAITEDLLTFPIAKVIQRQHQKYAFRLLQLQYERQNLLELVIMDIILAYNFMYINLTMLLLVPINTIIAYYNLEFYNSHTIYYTLYRILNYNHLLKQQLSLFVLVLIVSLIQIHL